MAGIIFNQKLFRGDSNAQRWKVIKEVHIFHLHLTFFDKLCSTSKQVALACNSFTNVNFQTIYKPLTTLPDNNLSLLILVLNLRGLVQEAVMYFKICWTLRTCCWHNMQATAPACNTRALTCTAEIVMQMFPSVGAKPQTCLSARKELPCPQEGWHDCKLHRFDVFLRRQFQELSFWLHSICRQIWVHLAHILPWGRHDLDMFVH